MEIVFAAREERVFACGCDAAGAAGAAASYARWGSTLSITVCAADAVRRVINDEPMPIHSVTTAIIARIHFSRAEASGSVLFLSRVISPKNTRWYDHKR